MEDEKKLHKILGNGKSYAIPEGYFDALPLRVQAKITRHRRRIAWMWRTGIAASLLVAVSAVGAWKYMKDNQEIDAQTIANVFAEDELQYGMMSNTEIALYLTEAD